MEVSPHQMAGFLRFTPNDSDNIDYDIKYLKNTFGSATSGVGTYQSDSLI